MPQFIRLDLFPAAIEVFEVDAEGVVGEMILRNDKTRVVITDDSIVVFVDSSDGPAELYNERLDDFSGDVKIGWIAITSNDNYVKITRGGGCGCGSRLKGYRPFPGVPHESR